MSKNSIMVSEKIKSLNEVIQIVLRDKSLNKDLQTKILTYLRDYCNKLEKSVKDKMKAGEND